MPYKYYNVSYTDSVIMIENQIKTIDTHNTFKENLIGGEGVIVDSLYEYTGLDPKTCHIDILHSYMWGEFTISGYDVFIKTYVPLKIYVDGANISKGETLQLVIKNGEPKIQIIQLKYKEIV